jgi:hypothetical protein
VSHLRLRLTGWGMAGVLVVCDHHITRACEAWWVVVVVGGGGEVTGCSTHDKKQQQQQQRMWSMQCELQRVASQAAAAAAVSIAVLCQVGGTECAVQVRQISPGSLESATVKVLLTLINC